MLNIAELGVLLLMFSVGLEIDLGSSRKVRQVTLNSGGLGVLVPLVMIVPVALLFHYLFEAALFVRMSMTATSVSISA